MPNPPDFPDSIRRYLRDYVVRRRRLTLLKKLATGVAATLCWTLFWAAIDRLVPLPALPRAAVGLADLCIVAFIIGPAGLANIRRSIHWHDAAVQVEQLDARFGGRLETAVSQLLLPPRARVQSGMLNQIVSETDALCSEPLPLVPFYQVRRPVMSVAGLVLLTTVLGQCQWLDLPALLHRQLHPFTSIAAVTNTRLIVETGSIAVAQGADVMIKVRTVPSDAATPTLHLEAGDERSSAMAMTRIAAGEFQAIVPAVDRDWQYEVTAADAKSDRFTLSVVRQPAVAAFKVSADYPSALRRGSATWITTSGSISAPAGTHVTLELQCTEPLRSAALLRAGRRFAATATADPAAWQVKLLIATSVDFDISLTSRRGVTSASQQLSIRALRGDFPLASPSPNDPTAAAEVNGQDHSIAGQAHDIAGYEDALRHYSDRMKREK